jgi:hypothetical protein
VTRIAYTSGGTAVEHLEVGTINGRRLRVRPRTVILACGGIENARLLLASGGPGAGRGTTGRYYMDHPKGVIGEVRAEPGVRRLIHPAYWDGRTGRFRLGIRLSEERQRRDELLDSYVRFHPILESDGAGAGALRAIRRRRLA